MSADLEKMETEAKYHVEASLGVMRDLVSKTHNLYAQPPADLGEIYILYALEGHLEDVLRLASQVRANVREFRTIRSLRKGEAE